MGGPPWTFGGAIRSVQAVTMQSAAAPGDAGAGADDAGDREAGQRSHRRGRRGLIDEGPLLREQRTSIIHGLMTAFGPKAALPPCLLHLEPQTRSLTVHGTKVA
jgi:hypothetical protein